VEPRDIHQEALKLSTGFGKARNPRYSMSDIVQVKKDIKLLYSLNRVNASPSQTVIPFATGVHSASAPAGYQGLNVSGGSMIGPIAYYPIVQNLTYSGGIGHLDISKSTGAFTSFILLGAVGTLQFYWIDGDAFDGQILKILIPATSTLYIHNGDGITTGNIFTSTGGTVDVSGINTVSFTFSSTQNGWILDSGIAGSAANQSLSNLTSPTTINQHLIPDTTNIRNLGSQTNWWSVLYINDVKFIDSTDPSGKFTDVAYNTTTHFLEYNLEVSGITAGQIFLYTSRPVFGACEGDISISGDIAYVDFYQNNTYLSATAGGASSLPSNPVGYLIVMINGIKRKMPYFAL